MQFKQELAYLGKVGEMKCLMILFVVSLACLSGCDSQEKKIESLIPQLNDENVEIRRDAVIKLSKINSPRVIPALMKALDDDSEHVFSIAEEALLKIGSPAVPALMRSREKPRAWKTLVKMREIAVPTLVEELSGERRLDAMLLLAEIGRPSVPSLIKVLETGDKEVRRIAIATLGLIGEPAKEAGSVLEKELSGENTSLRIEAAYVLYQIDSSKQRVILSTLQEILSDKGIEDSNRVAAVDLLERINTPESLEVLSEYRMVEIAENLKHEDLFVRRSAARKMDKVIVHKGAIPFAMQAMKDEDVFVRTYAARVLYRIDKTKQDMVLPQLIESIKLEDWWTPPVGGSILVTDLAMTTLREIGTDEALEAIEKYYPWYINLDR